MLQEKSKVREVTLCTLFTEQSRKSITAIGEKIFREERGLSKDTGLGELGFWFDNGQFSLTDNFAILPQGILFHYNSYEIASYAMGETTILLPYESIKKFVKPEIAHFWSL